MSTVESLGPTVSASLSTSTKPRLRPIGRPVDPLARRISVFSAWFSRLSCRDSAARRQTATSSSLENGFWM
jgi:hypothetical protein